MAISSWPQNTALGRGVSARRVCRARAAVGGEIAGDGMARVGGQARCGGEGGELAVQARRAQAGGARPGQIRDASVAMGDQVSGDVLRAGAMVDADKRGAGGDGGF